MIGWDLDLPCLRIRVKGTLVWDAHCAVECGCKEGWECSGCV